MNVNLYFKYSVTNSTDKFVLYVIVHYKLFFVVIIDIKSPETGTVDWNTLNGNCLWNTYSSAVSIDTDAPCYV